MYIQSSVEPGGLISIRIVSNSPSESFRGFLIQAHNPNSNTFGPLGTFMHPPDTAKAVTCSPGYQAYTSLAKQTLGIRWN